MDKMKSTELDGEECIPKRLRGTLAAFPLGLVALAIGMALLDMAFGIVPGWLSLSWVEELLGLLSGNLLPGTATAGWLYLAMVSASVAVGLTAVKIHKAVLCAVLLPITCGVAYTLLGYSTGRPIELEEMIIRPTFSCLPYLIPAAAAAGALTMALSVRGLEPAPGSPPGAVCAVSVEGEEGERKNF
jgi:hypothetical protein